MQRGDILPVFIPSSIALIFPRLCSSNSNYKACCLEACADAFLVKLEAFSIKQVVLYQESESLSLHQVGLADGRELNELIMLDKRDVTKFMVVDISFRFLAHKCTRDFMTL